MAYMVHSSEYRAEQAVASGHFIYITLILNIALSFLDEKRLKKAGMIPAHLVDGCGWCPSISTNDPKP